MDTNVLDIWYYAFYCFIDISYLKYIQDVGHSEWTKCKTHILKNVIFEWRTFFKTAQRLPYDSFFMLTLILLQLTYFHKKYRSFVQILCFMINLKIWRILFTFHTVRLGRGQILLGCCGCWGHIRTATAVPPLPCAHTVQHNAKLSHCLWSENMQKRCIRYLWIATRKFLIPQIGIISIKNLTILIYKIFATTLANFGAHRYFSNSIFPKIYFTWIHITELPITLIFISSIYLVT